MKKLTTVALCCSILLLSIPISANATSSDTEIINTHGTKTYMGTSADWSDTWDSDNFTDVTGEDVSCSDDLIIKGGKIGDVSASGSEEVTITGGTMGDVTCGGTIDMSGGKADSLESSSDISISGGTVSGDVEADDAVNLYGKLAVSGTVTGADVTVEATSSSGKTAVSDGVSFSGQMVLEGSNYSLGSIDGQNSGNLEIENCTASLPEISDVDEISVSSDSSVSLSSALDIDALSLSDDSQFAAYSTLTAGTITGPGILIFNAGNLTVNTGISDSPIFVLNGSASTGTTVFKAASGTVSSSDAVMFGYSLTEGTYNSSYDKFVLSAASGNGVSLNSSSVSVANGSSASVTATVTPALSELSSGTQLCWKLIDPTSTFSITPNSNNNSCTINESGTSSTAQATLVAYLADSSGNLLSDYKTASCTLSATASSSSSTPAISGSSTSGLSLDTKTVTIPVSHKYYVLAITNGSTPPVQMSYNSAIAVTGKATAYNYHGKVGWLYPITAVSKGSVTIKIGGQTMIATVS